MRWTSWRKDSSPQHTSASNDVLKSPCITAAWMGHRLHLFETRRMTGIRIDETTLAAALERRVGLQNVYLYDDKDYNCADSNPPIAAYLNDEPLAVHTVKKCTADCCGGDEGVLLKKYEHNNPFHNA